MSMGRHRGWMAIAALGAGALALGALTAPASLAEPSAPGASQPSTAVKSDPNSSPPQVLFVADVAKARVIKAHGEVRLSLPARASMTWFSDRPERHTGRTNLQQLVNTWSAIGFDTDPPNAALILTDRRGRERIHVVQMRDPRRVGSWIHMAITVVGDSTEAGYANIHGLKAGRYTRAQVFIDDAANPPCPTLVTTATNCIMTDQPVAFRSLSSNEVGAVAGCGVGESGRIDWQVQAQALNVANGRIVHDERLFANGLQVFACSVDSRPIDIVTVFPSVNAQTYNQMTLTNQSFIGGESTMGPGGVPSNPSWSPILLTYNVSAD